VTSRDGSINCGSACSASYGNGGVVLLTATPALGSTFAGWSGGACSGTSTCTLNVSAAGLGVTATFTAIQYALTINTFGSGSGTVSSSPAGLSCGPTCSANFNYNTTVTLTASATSGGFTGWAGGGCTGTSPTCVVTMLGAMSVIASFGPPGPTSWDPLWSVGGGTFSNGYLSITNTAPNTVNFRTTIGKSTGKWYWEITATAGNGSTDSGGLGIMASTEPNYTSWIGSSASGLSFGYGSCCSQQWWYNWPGVTVGAAPPTTAAINAGIVYMFAIDMDNGRFWVGQNGTWYNGGNPSTATSPNVTGIAGTVYPGVTLYGSRITATPAAFTANFGASAFVYSVPTGFNGGFY
jgi:hypothetical protein